MATIGVYRSQGTDNLKIRAIHINVWMLPASISLRSLVAAAARRSWHAFYLDVGIRIEAPDGLPASIELLLPQDWHSSRSFTDLAAEVVDPEISDLIFGSNVVVDGHNISYTQDIEPITEICVPVDQLQRISPQRYRMVFRDRPPGRNFYARFRVQLSRSEATMHGKGWGYAKRGFIFDLRVNDVRETIDLPAQDKTDRMHEVEGAYIFAIVPNTFISAMHSPDLKYVRSLEVGLWKPYLHGCTDVSLQHRASIYYWKRADQVTSVTPFRTYMHLHTDFGIWVLMLYVFGLLAVPTLVGVLREGLPFLARIFAPDSGL